MKYETFIFESFEYSASSNEAAFRYAIDDAYMFTETLTVPAEAASLDRGLRDRLLFNLHLALGISYWKAYCPPNIAVRSGKLNQDQAEFWNTIYTKGLGEFYYENKIDFRGLVQFPVAKDSDVSRETSSSDSASRTGLRPPLDKFHSKSSESNSTSKVLVPIGGGKDSLTTLALLKEKGVSYETYSLNSYDIIEQQVKKLGLNHLSISRSLDEKLFSLPDAYNGHVPISMIYAFTALLTAASEGHQYIVLSNERSANYGNVEYLGEQVNHQWSKSFEFETIFRKYVAAHITDSVEYFSLLRPYYEIQIAKIFAEHYPKNRIPWTSCNANFAIRKQSKKLWCGECAKCAFVFTILSPFIKKRRLIKQFGKNMFDDENLLPLFQQLLGVADMKPFDCVGTPEEMIVAMHMTQNEYMDSVIMGFFIDTMLPTVDNIDEMTDTVFSISNEHAIPQRFQ